MFDELIFLQFLSNSPLSALPSDCGCLAWSNFSCLKSNYLTIALFVCADVNGDEGNDNTINESIPLISAGKNNADFKKQKIRSVCIEAMMVVRWFMVYLHTFLPNKHLCKITFSKNRRKRGCLAFKTNHFVRSKHAHKRMKNYCHAKRAQQGKCKQNSNFNYIENSFTWRMMLFNRKNVKRIIELIRCAERKQPSYNDN